MPVTHRPMLPTEEDAALDLWVEVLETSSDEAIRTFHDFREDPQRFEHTCVALADDGTLLSTICYWLRDVRDSAGAPTRVGHLYHIATRVADRNQGHAGRLLPHIIHTLYAQGCTWAVLSARQLAVPLYTRFGWQALPRQYWRGTV